MSEDTANTPADVGSVAPSPPARRKRFSWRRIGALLALLVLVFAGLRVTGTLESALFYAPTRSAFATPPGYEDVSIPSTDGVILHAWWMPPKNQSLAGADGRLPAVLHVHGNAINVSGHDAFSKFLPGRGVGVLLFDYRGFGRSTGATILRREQLMADTRAAHEYLRSRSDVDPARIGVYAQSIGGTFGLQLAAERKEITAICALSAFSSWNAIATDHASLFGKLMTPDGFDPAASAVKLDGRALLLVHGDRDDVVPLKHGRIIAEAARAGGARVTMLEVEKGSHNGALFQMRKGGKDARSDVGDFFVQELGPRQKTE